jgi:Glycosyl hydrolases family 15
LRDATYCVETWRVMFLARLLVASVSIVALASIPACASHMVTGNGFGFAVVSPETVSISKFYAHPHSYIQPDAKDPLSEGVETANFIKAIRVCGTRPANASAEYQEDSQVIHMRCKEGEGFAFMPFGFERAALVIAWVPVWGSLQSHLEPEWNHSIRSHRKLRISGATVHLLKFSDITESLLLIPLGPPQTSERGSQFLASNSAWALISLENEAELRQVVSAFAKWRAGLAPSELVNRETSEIERWRVHPNVHFASEEERHLWRQSEMMLRIAQSREPNRPGRNGHGFIVASLPDGLWFTPWVRDMAYATVALARMGHRDEARAALLAYFNAQPTGKLREETAGADYQVSVVRYFGDGAEEPFFTMEGSTNIEFDDWGEVLWALGEYMREYDDAALLNVPTYRGRLYDSARDYVFKPLLANLEKYNDGLIVAADTSIWEERQRDKKHFAFSTAAAILGLKSFAAVASRAGDEAARTDAMIHVAALERGFRAAFIRGGKLRGTLEEEVKNDIDGALLAVINLGIVTDPAVVLDTVQRMTLLKVASGGYRRVRSTYADPAIFEYWYERQEFVFVDFSLAEVYRSIGRDAEASAILKRIVDKAATDHNIIPEMYVAESCKLFPGNLGDPTGALPMVGYGAGAYIVQLMQRNGHNP